MRVEVRRDVYCVVCGKEVPPERARKRATTCSQEHAKARATNLRRLLDQKKCRYCMKPSTPEERESFKRWRKWVRQHPEEQEALVKEAAENPEVDDDGEDVASIV